MHTGSASTDYYTLYIVQHQLYPLSFIKLWSLPALGFWGAAFQAVVILTLGEEEGSGGDKTSDEGTGPDGNGGMESSAEGITFYPSGVQWILFNGYGKTGIVTD